MEVEIQLALRTDSWGGLWAYAYLVSVNGRPTDGGGFCYRYKDEIESDCFLIATEDAVLKALEDIEKAGL